MCGKALPFREIASICWAPAVTEAKLRCFFGEARSPRLFRASDGKAVNLLLPVWSRSLTWQHSAMGVFCET
jgi:hypothetical protein